MTEALVILLAWFLVGSFVVAWKWDRLVNNGLPEEGRVPVVLGTVLLWPLMVVCVVLDWIEEKLEETDDD